MDASSAEVAELLERMAALRGAVGRMRADLDTLAAAEQALANKLHAMGIAPDVGGPRLPPVEDITVATVIHKSRPPGDALGSQSSSARPPPTLSSRPPGSTVSALEEEASGATIADGSRMPGRAVGGAAVADGSRMAGRAVGGAAVGGARDAAPVDAESSEELPAIPGLPLRRKKSASDGAAGAPGAAGRGRESSPMKAAAVGAGLTLGLALVVLVAVNIQIARRGETSTTSPPSVVSGPTVSAPVLAVAPASASVVAVTPAPAPSVDPLPKPEMGALTIVCTPRCDSIVDNGTPLSPGNLVAVPVAAGPHKIVLAGNGAKRTFSVTVAPGQTRDSHASLESAGVDRGF